MPVTHGVAGSSPVRTARIKFRICTRCGSSAWLEDMPVTHGVAGSSPVRTAKENPKQSLRIFLFFTNPGFYRTHRMSILSVLAPHRSLIHPSPPKIFLHPRKKVTHFFCPFKKIAYLCTRISARSTCFSENPLRK